MTAAMKQIATRHFGARMISLLAKKGIEIVALTTIPGSGPMQFANGETGYVITSKGEQSKVVAAYEIRKLAGK